MNTEEIRKKTLEILYKNRDNPFYPIESLQKEMSDISERELHQEIMYLSEKGKGYLTRKGVHSGKYLNFYGVEITSLGIDLVENPKEFGELFSVNIQNIGNIENSGNGNVQVAKDNSSQKISQNNIPPEILEQLKIAIEKKDKSMLCKVLNEFEDGAKTVFWNTVSSLII